MLGTMLSFPSSRSAFVYLSLLSLLIASLQAAETCSTVQSTHPDINILYPHYLEYNLTVGDYWSTGCAALKPSCVLLPRSAQQVSDIVKILRANNEEFAIKSGGHSPNRYFSSIHGGPLIATKLLNEVSYNPTTQTACVGPGNHWHNVSFAMQGTGMNVVGGRMGDVGVGGYLLGGRTLLHTNFETPWLTSTGGLSFLSAERGWAATHIMEAEVVLADGSIVKASKTTNPDLLAAIKGGGSNFGIVTSFTLRAFPQGQVTYFMRTSMNDC
jgi:FAD/FMN-containing dehydrogenase